MRLVPIVLAVLAITACGDEPGTTLDGGTPDAPPGVGCTATTPRAVPLEAFIGPSGLESRMLAAINGAQRSIDLQMYLFTVQSIADALIAAKQRGVAVRVILDPDEPGNVQVRPDLVAAGVPTRDATPLYTYSHAKYLLVDDATAYVMSMNFNYDALSMERNYGVVDKDPEDVADVAAIFAMDWAAAGGESAKPADLSCTRLVVSPNNAKLRLLELVNSATSTLEIAVMYLTETTIRNAVGAAKARGVAVRVILEVPDVLPDATTTYLQGLGIPVKYATTYLLHAKLIVADGVAFVGSENLSQTSLTKNREVGVIASEAAAVAPISAQFETDWNNSSAP
ncbi:MAG: phospholipase D-like domain-containing protein [Proteobacteria bacterium]|nr:phospholipase D-like domain-containing protein [Pseudomonadota bacterium]